MQTSLRLYRDTRAQARNLLAQVLESGYDAVRVEGDGDLADICRLTCLEQKLRVAEDEDACHVPALVVEGMQLFLHWPQNSDSVQSDER